MQLEKVIPRQWWEMFYHWGESTDDQEVLLVWQDQGPRQQVRAFLYSHLIKPLQVNDISDSPLVWALQFNVLILMWLDKTWPLIWPKERLLTIWPLDQVSTNVPNLYHIPPQLGKKRCIESYLAEISIKRSYLAVISFLAARVIYLLSFPLLSHIGGGTFHDDRRGLSGRLNNQN